MKSPVFFVERIRSTVIVLLLLLRQLSIRLNPKALYPYLKILLLMLKITKTVKAIAVLLFDLLQ